MPNCEGTAGCSKRSVPRSAPCSPCRPSRSPSCRKGRETDPADGRQPTEDRRRARRGCRGQGTPRLPGDGLRLRPVPASAVWLPPPRRTRLRHRVRWPSPGAPDEETAARGLPQGQRKQGQDPGREPPPHPKGKRGRTGNSPPPAGASGHHVFRRDGAGTSDPEFEGPVSMIEAAPCERDALEGLSGPATRQGTCAGNCSCVRSRRHSRLQEQAPGCKAR